LFSLWFLDLTIYSNEKRERIIIFLKMKNLTSILRSKLAKKINNERNSCIFNENFDQLFTEKQQKNSFLINLSKFNYNDIECTSSPIVDHHKIIKQRKSINIQVELNIPNN
jgi:hypothetical protein